MKKKRGMLEKKKKSNFKKKINKKIEEKLEKKKVKKEKKKAPWITIVIHSALGVGE